MEYAFKSDIGQIRNRNEDYCDVFIDENKGIYFFVLADGMGGHNAGEMASKLTVDTILETVKSNLDNIALVDDEINKLISDAIDKANIEVMKFAIEDDSRTGMGTTLVVAAIYGKRALIAHVGDSRAYLIDDSSISQITTDHSFVEELIKEGSLSREEAKVHPKRNVITRAIGVSSKLDVDYNNIGFESPKLILICSDGLTNCVEDSDIYNIVSGCGDADEICKLLIKAANDKGGYDNISVMLIKS